MRHWKKFKKDRFYLIKYLTTQMMISIVIISIQLSFIDSVSFFKFHFEWWNILLLPIGLIIGVKMPVLIHNCVHGNIKPTILNEVAGEIAGIYVLLSMAAFELNHYMHHAHSDTDLDPHNPHKKNFIPFFFANNFGGTRVVQHKFFQFHGNTQTNKSLFDLVCVLHFLNVPLRILFWILLFGPTLFLTFFIPSYLFHMFVFAHINYKTHETKENGEVVLHNLNSNCYYRFVNYFGNGVYFHKNHHQNPHYYNPQLGKSHKFFGSP
ncbi:MAG: fatty acid desaturase [Bacteriovoracaceae bacterium]